jgi:CRP/FNR family transcriptional regulator, anaerobic regulatory protein
MLSNVIPVSAHTPQTATRAPTLATVLPVHTDHQVDERIGAMLRLLQDTVPLTRRVVHKGDTIYQVGERFVSLHVVNAGFFKTINLAPDGREQVVGLHFKGDWMGFDGIAQGQYGCDAVAIDTAEVWSLRYDSLLAACAQQPALMGALHSAMSREITRDRDCLMSLCTLSADARVADFLRYWAESLAQRGLRNDQITLRMTRAEIGNYLGMTLETVSRALSRLARESLITFNDKGRRDMAITDLDALKAFVQRSLPAAVSAAATLQ